VRGLSFDGNKAIDNETLAAAISTTNSDWFARTPVVRSFLGSKRRLNEKDLERDVERLRLLYRIFGYLEVQVDTVVSRSDEDVHIKFLITEGEPVRLSRLDILGTDSLPRHDRLVRDLPLRIGDPFNRQWLQATGDTLTARLRELGYPAARVFLLGRTVDSAAREAQVVLRVQAGRLQVIGRIQVEGATPSDSAFIVTLMAARTGERYRRSNLLRSQRNIAATESYRFVSVEIDTSLYVPEADSVPLIVRLVPGARYRVGASAGYGTDDCFRGSASLTIRNMFRQGRLLENSGRLTKIGTGDPLDFGLDETFLCSRLADDPIGSSKLNYSGTISLRQPAFLSPDNVLGLPLFAERRSEFARTCAEVGGAVTRRASGQPDLITVGIIGGVP
jgi:outer membrane protein assembly factor BamA